MFLRDAITRLGISCLILAGTILVMIHAGSPEPSWYRENETLIRWLYIAGFLSIGAATFSFTTDRIGRSYEDDDIFEENSWGKTPSNGLMLILGLMIIYILVMAWGAIRFSFLPEGFFGIIRFIVSAIRIFITSFVVSLYMSLMPLGLAACAFMLMFSATRMEASTFWSTIVTLRLMTIPAAGICASLVHTGIPMAAFGVAFICFAIFLSLALSLVLRHEEEDIRRWGR
mgnify:CR=1 FL=1